jgi:hypothetical protein
MGYAYILTHPGTPCVLWDHFFDWGGDIQGHLNSLLQAGEAPKSLSQLPPTHPSHEPNSYQSTQEANSRPTTSSNGAGTCRVTSTACCRQGQATSFNTSSAS